MASPPARLLSLVIVALVVILGVRGIVGSFALGGHILDTSPGSHSSAAGGDARRCGYVLDGDTVQVTTVMAAM